MDRDKLYEAISERKQDPAHLLPYTGGNGRIDRFLNLVRDGQLERGGVIVDVGGSHGDLVYAAVHEHLFQTGVVVDISERAVETALRRGLRAQVVDVDRQGLPIRDGAANGLPDTKGCHGINMSSFATAVTALDFIEHIVDPDNFARECFRVLKPGGYVFINTPNIQFWKHLESLVCHGIFPHTSGDREVYHGGHLAFYGLADMERIFGDAGFDDFRQFASENRVSPPPIWTNILQWPSQKKKMDVLSDPDLLFFARKPL